MKKQPRFSGQCRHGEPMDGRCRKCFPRLVLAAGSVRPRGKSVKVSIESGSDSRVFSRLYARPLRIYIDDELEVNLR